MELFPSNSNIDFMRARHVTLAVFAALVIGALALLATRGFNFALDFTGGTVVEVEFGQPVDVEAVRSKLAGAGYENPVVQTFGSGNDISIRLQPPKGEGAQAAPSTAKLGADILAAAQTAGNPGRVVRADVVGPQIGSELAWNGLYAAILVMLGFLGYI